MFYYPLPPRPWWPVAVRVAGAVPNPPANLLKPKTVSGIKNREIYMHAWPVTTHTTDRRERKVAGTHRNREQEDCVDRRQRQEIAGDEAGARRKAGRLAGLMLVARKKENNIIYGPIGSRL